MSLLDRILPWRVRENARKAVYAEAEMQERIMRIRSSEATMNAIRHFASGTESRRRPNWDVLSMHADAEMLPSLPTMRSRSRLMCDTDAKASGLVKKELTNVIGPSVGVQASLPSQYDVLNDEERKRYTDRAEKWFWEKVQSQHRDFDRRRQHSWFTMTRLRFDHFRKDGSLFVRYHMKKDRSIPFCCEIIEYGRIRTPAQYVGNNRVRDGIQFSSDDEFEGVWVMTQHPTDPFNGGKIEFEFVPARNPLGLPNIVHFFDPHRYSASQGLPWLNTALPLLNDIADYKDAELRAKMLEAVFGVFGTFNRPEQTMEDLANSGGGLNAGRGLGSGTPEKRTMELPLFKTMFSALEKGEDIKTVQSDRPGNNFTPFMDREDRDIGLAIGRSFERVSNNYGAANFSATRVSGIEDDVEYKVDFTMFSDAVLTADWEWAMLALSIQDGNPIYREMRPAWQKYVKRSWDGLKDAKESTELQANGTTDPITECQKHGLDFYDTVRNRIAAEVFIREQRKKAGLDDPKEQTDSAKKPEDGNAEPDQNAGE